MMINFAVINFKSAIKNLCKILIVLLLVIGIVNLSDLIKNSNIEFSYINLVKSCISFEFDSKIQKENSLEKTIFFQEMPILAAGENISNSDSEDLEITEEANSSDEAVQTAIVSNEETTSLENLTTEVVSENNIAENYNTLYGEVKIKNETSFELTEDILTPDVEFTNTTDVVIFHTHTCESYTPTEENTYVASR